MLARTITTLAMVASIGVASLVGPGAAPALADTPTPPGFEVVNRTPVAAGVERFELERAKPPLRVHVARISPDAAVSLRADRGDGDRPCRNGNVRPFSV